MRTVSYLPKRRHAFSERTMFRLQAVSAYLLEAYLNGGRFYNSEEDQVDSEQLTAGFNLSSEEILTRREGLKASRLSKNT